MWDLSLRSGVRVFTSNTWIRPERSDQEAVTAERGGGNYVGEGGDGGGRREGLGIEDFEGSGVSGGKRVRW